MKSGSGASFSLKSLGIVFWIGLGVILGYWIYLHPPGFSSMGYGEDLGSIELAREVMADSLKNFGGPKFVTTRLMAPLGTSTAFFSWALERDWIGAIVWNWSHSFPWLWVYLGISFVISYVGVGSILGRMFSPIWQNSKFTSNSAWAIATLVVFFNVPRHHKANQHFEHLIQHWTYLGVFLDAWIWQRLWRDRRWSLSLEMWRGFCFLGAFNLGGYHWSAMILEWSIVRVSMICTWFVRSVFEEQTRFEVNAKKLFLPVGLISVLLIIQLCWFIPLMSEVRSLGIVPQAMGWEANLQLVFRPLWLEQLMDFMGFFSTEMRAWFQGLLSEWKLFPIDGVETVVSIGWVYLIPITLAFWVVRKKKSGPGIGLLLPFSFYFVFLVAYSCIPTTYGFQDSFADTLPFFRFFRVVSRAGLFMPATAGALIALAWPEIFKFVSERIKKREGVFQGFRIVLAAFFVSSAAELTILKGPILTMPPLDDKMKSILEQIRGLPGTTVLNMPFCVIGGNGVCGYDECPNYPRSVAPSLLTGWHDKKVYGIYLARLVPSQCTNYNQYPYTAWFKAWGQQRCLQGWEWDSFCEYLDQHREISAVMIFSGIWTAAANPQCRALLDSYLGKPIDEGDIFTGGSPGGAGRDPSHVLWYGAKCMRTK